MLHHCTKSILYFPTCLSVHFKGHFSRWTSVSRFYFVEAKDDGSGGDNWSYKSCKAPINSSPPTNQHPVFYRPDVLPVTQPTVSKHWREINTYICPCYSVTNYFHQRGYVLTSICVSVCLSLWLSVSLSICLLTGWGHPVRWWASLTTHNNA